MANILERRCEKCGVQNAKWVSRHGDDWLYFNYLGHYTDINGQRVEYADVPPAIFNARVNKVYVANGLCQWCKGD